MKMPVLEDACVEDPCFADCVEVCDVCVENACVEDALVCVENACACVEDVCVVN